MRISLTWIAGGLMLGSSVLMGCTEADLSKDRQNLYTATCVDGVQYWVYNNRMAPRYNTNGQLVTCNAKLTASDAHKQLHQLINNTTVITGKIE